jgi:hypothetical protein
VARSYRDALASNDYSLSDGSGKIPDWAGNQIKQYPPGHQYYNSVIDGLQDLFKGRIAEQDTQWPNQPWMAEDNKRGLQSILDSLGRLRSGDATLAPRGRMYEVDINADPQSFLPWDKPASQWPNQPLSAVQDLAASQGMRLGDVTGERLYQQLATSISDFGRHTGGDQQAASEALGQAGIPGIRYLDQQSRNAGGWHITPADQTVSGKWMVKSNDYNSQGMHFDTEAEAQKALQAKIGGQTSNYVVFDPKIIDILRKYAVPGLISGGGAAGIANAGSQ